MSPPLGKPWGRSSIPQQRSTHRSRAVPRRSAPVRRGHRRPLRSGAPCHSGPLAAFGVGRAKQNLALRQSPFDRGIENREVSAIVADAVVDTVVLLPHRAVERRRTRRLRNAGPINGRAGPGDIVLPEKLPRRSLPSSGATIPPSFCGSAATPVVSAVEMMTMSANFAIVSSCLLRPPAWQRFLTQVICFRWLGEKMTKCTFTAMTNHSTSVWFEFRRFRQPIHWC